MYKFQDYYGDYYGEEAPCDPYYEDCAVEEEPVEDDMMMEEDAVVSAPMWVVIPLLDLSSAYWQFDSWRQTDYDDTVDGLYELCMKCDMQQTYMLEAALGSVALFGWFAAEMMDMSAPFLIISKLQILSEATMIYMQYRGW